MTRPYDVDLFITQSNAASTVQARAARVGEPSPHPLTLPFDPARLPDRRRDDQNMRLSLTFFRFIGRRLVHARA